MQSFARRIAATAFLMGICCAVTFQIRSGYTFEVLPLQFPLSDIPVTLKDWEGTDVPLDKEVQEVLNADDFVNRSYRHIDGNSVLLHASAWVRPDSVAAVAPHTPKVCYTNSGWTIVDERLTSIDTGTVSVPINTLLLERQGELIVVAYWYQMGSATFTTSSEARQLHRSLWGKSRWPSTIKVLLQTNASTIESGLPRISRFATEIHQRIENI